jgi:hypothetical protein
VHNYVTKQIFLYKITVNYIHICVCVYIYIYIYIYIFHKRKKKLLLLLFSNFKHYNSPSSITDIHMNNLIQ